MLLSPRIRIESFHDEASRDAISTSTYADLCRQSVPITLVVSIDSLFILKTSES
jgi:hypothetical protein